MGLGRGGAGRGTVGTLQAPGVVQCVRVVLYWCVVASERMLMVNYSLTNLDRVLYNTHTVTHTLIYQAQ